MRIIYQDFISRDDVRANRDKVFLFGDNAMKQGFGGQAKEMRGEPNAVGIPTKKSPQRTEDAYFKDGEFENNVALINAAFEKIPKDRIVVISKAGIGTGLAELKVRAPKTFGYLQRKLDDLQKS